MRLSGTRPLEPAFYRDRSDIRMPTPPQCGRIYVLRNSLYTIRVAGECQSASSERHPEIPAAIDALHSAKDYLEHANHNFQGHRTDAINAMNEADRQLHLCLEAD